jgi:hypothetical protein
MQLLMNGKIKRLPILERIQKGWSTKVKIVRVSGLKLGRKKVTKDGSRNKVKINPKNGKNVGIKKWMMMKKWRNQIVKNGVKIRKKSGMRDGVKYIRMDRNKSGLTNGLLRME